MSSAGDTQTALALAQMGFTVEWGRQTHPRQCQPGLVRPGMEKHSQRRHLTQAGKGVVKEGFLEEVKQAKVRQSARHLRRAFSPPLTPTGMQGSTPLDVAAASVIDNNELALALQEQDLEKVWREKAWPIPGPLGHLLIWVLLYGCHCAWSRTESEGE